MKKIIFSFLTMLLVTVVVSAQVTDTTGTTGATQSGQTPGYQQGEQGDFVKIRVDELPASVSKSLEGNEYNNWNVSNAYKNSRTGEYRVEMRSGTQTKVYTFDKDGKRSDKMGVKEQETKDQSTSPESGTTSPAPSPAPNDNK